jgi:hypothetical protein
LFGFVAELELKRLVLALVHSTYWWAFGFYLNLEEQLELQERLVL